MDDTFAGQLEVRDIGAVDRWARVRVPNFEWRSNSSLSVGRFSRLSLSELVGFDDFSLEYKRAAIA